MNSVNAAIVLIIVTFIIAYVIALGSMHVGTG